MTDVTNFPKAKPGPQRDLDRVLQRDLKHPDTRTFIACVFTRKGDTDAYVPDDLTLADLLMARAVLDRYISKLID